MMAGIYIPGMKMPATCYDCPLQDDECFGSIKCCYAQTWGSANMRAVDCPLIPVPDHGRLADLDKIETEIARLSPEGYTTGGIRLILDYAPTIIPAEEET